MRTRKLGTAGFQREGRKKREARPSLPQRVMYATLAVVFVFGLTPTGAFASEESPIEKAPQPQMTLQTSGIEQESLVQDGAPELAATAGGMAAQAIQTILATQSGEAQNYALFDKDAGTLTFYYGEKPDTVVADAIYEGYDTGEQHPWTSQTSTITNTTKIVFDSSVTGHLAPTSTEKWFRGFTQVNALEGLEYLDTSNVTDMSNMFDNFGRSSRSPLTTLDLSSFDTSSVTNMAGMFVGAERLKNITFGEQFSTNNVTDMSGMFNNCNDLEALDFGEGFDTSNVTDMSDMFYCCHKLKSLDLTGFNTSSVTDMHRMFALCNTLETLELDESFDTSSVTNMSGMFGGCWAISDDGLNGFLTVADTSGVADMERMFYACEALDNPDFTHFNTKNVKTFSAMFDGCSGLTKLDLSSFSTDAATTLSHMFCDCANLSTITFGDSFTVKSATSLESMFINCKKLESIDLTKWDTSKVNSMTSLFYGCSELAELDLSSFDTSSANRLDQMFRGCGKLCSVTLGEAFNCKGANIKYAQYWALLPTPPESSSNQGKWQKDDGGTLCTPAEIQELTGAAIAGTWSWTATHALEISSGKGGTAVASQQAGLVGETATLIATPDDGYTFTCWTLTSGTGTGELSGTTENPATFTFGSGNGAVKATFAKEGYEYAYTVGALSASSFTYNGQMQVPTFTVRDEQSNEALEEGVDYMVGYKNGGTAVEHPTAAGTYTVYVTGAANYAGAGTKSAGEFTITPSYTVSGTLACESGWTPAGDPQATWGTLRVMRPTASGGYQQASIQWPTGSEFALESVAPGSQIVFTPLTASDCSSCTFQVPFDLAADLSGVTLTAPYVNGTVRFASLDYVAADRLYDPETGAAYTTDDNEATRTTSISLVANYPRVKATAADGREVPVSIIDGKSLVIKDDAAHLVAGARYTLTIGMRDPVFALGYFSEGASRFAANAEVEVTLADLGNGCIGANGVNLKGCSLGRADIHYSNPAGAKESLFLYDGNGNLVGESTLSNKGDGVIPTRFLDEGGYTICAVERDVYGALATSGDGNAKAPATLAELRGFGFEPGQLVERSFAIQDNKLIDVGVNSPLLLPATSVASDVIDRANSSVTATNSYSSFTTITINASLLDGADTALLSDQTAGYRPTLRIYTNQKQIVDNGSSTGRMWCWPQSLSINGRPVALESFLSKNKPWAMTSGWIDLDLYEVYPGYAGAESFPLTVSLTVPRTDFSRTQASAYLLLPGRSNFIGSYDQATDELSLVAPEVVAEKTFTAQGYTAAGANVVIFIDGIEAASTKADEYGYYAARLTLPGNAEDLDVFGVQATATWNDEGKECSASSEVLDVTYSTTRASLKRLWMLTQHGKNGPWDYILAYNDGEWSSMYKGYYLGGSWANRRFIWIAEFNNAEYATNVKCIVPRSEGELSLPMTRDMDEADGWLSLSNPGSEWYVGPEALSTQSLVEPGGLAQMGLRGTIDCNKGAEIIKGYLQGGNAYVSEPVHLTSAPSGVYVTYDDVERQTLPESEAYTGFSELDEADVAAYISALNENSNHMLVVEKDLNEDGKLVKADPTAAAASLVRSEAGQVDRWIAVAFNLDPDTKGELENPVWMQLHHTVVTTAADMSEPETMISNVQNKYAEYLANIAAAIAAGGTAQDATTYCPCKEAATGGIPILEMYARDDDDPDPVRYFVWTEDSNRNAYIRFMERLEIADSNAVAYRQYEADERQLVITEWNGQTRQKRVLTFQIADSFVNGLIGGQHDTDFEFLMDLWTFVGYQMQLGAIDAQEALVAGGEMQESDMVIEGPLSMAAQAGTGSSVVDNMVNSLGGGVRWVFEGAEDNIKSVSRCVMDELDWQAKGWKSMAVKYGLAVDWGSLSDDELKSLIRFVNNNNSDCLWMASASDASSQNGKKVVVTPYSDTVSKVFRGLYKRGAYDTTTNAFNKGQSIVKDGVAKTVVKEFESRCMAKTYEGYKNYVYGRRGGVEASGASKYSNEYFRIVKALFDYEQKMKEMGFTDCNIDWSAIPDDLYYSFKFTRDARSERAQRARNNGSIWPRGKYDPSGFVYEGMLSNPVEGATVSLYTYNPAGDSQAGFATLVDSEKFGYEPNPQVTGADGRYQWFVGTGYWQVRVTKDGYEPVSTGSSNAYGIGATKDPDGDGIDGTTWWMPVLPEQIDVNIPLVSTAAPVVESAEGTSGGVLVTFSKPLKIDTVSADMFTLQWADSEKVLSPAAIEPVGADVAADGSLGTDGKAQQLARTFLVRYPAGTVLESAEYEISVAFTNAADAAVSYAGTAAESGSATSKFTVTKDASTIKLANQGKAYTGKALGYTGTVTKTGSTGKVTYTYYSDAKCTKSVAPQNVKKTGTYYVKATLAADENYEAAMSAPAKLTIAKLTVKPKTTSYIYNGKVRKPGVIVKFGSTTLTSKNYTATYAKGRKNVGAYKIAVKLKGAYVGTATTSFKIVPKGTSISKVTPAKRGFTAKWKKQAAQTTGYQVQYALSKSFKNAKTATVKSAKTVSKKVSNLKAGKKYWVHVRTYKKVGKATYYSSWSKAKTVTTKK